MRSRDETHASALKAALADLEGGDHAFLAPSGLAAVTIPLLALLGPGDEVVADFEVTDQQGNPVPVAPRNVLKRIVKLYEKEGWRPVVAPT